MCPTAPWYGGGHEVHPPKLPSKKPNRQRGTRGVAAHASAMQALAGAPRGVVVRMGAGTGAQRTRTAEA